MADQRGCSQTDFFRSYHSFIFGAYQEVSRQPFGALCLLNDDTLRAGASLSLQVEQDTVVIVLPIVGGLEYTCELANDFLEPGQVGHLSLKAGTTYSVSNPYEAEAINVLQIWLTNVEDGFRPSVDQVHFSLSQRNTLLSILESSYKGFIGQFDGRQEGTYSVSSSEKGVFVFVIQGVFEVANRLLHARDGLALLDIQDGTIEFEALSNDAILLLVEI